MGLKVAHIKEQGQNMILVPLDRSFGYKPEHEKREFLAYVQNSAGEAGLAGRVVLFWPSSGGATFLGPPEWHPFLRGLSMSQVVRSLNMVLNC